MVVPPALENESLMNFVRSFGLRIARLLTIGQRNMGEKDVQRWFDSETRAWVCIG